jgi:hypothetical protein
MAIYFIYKKEKINEEKILWGCLAIKKNKNNEIEQYKITMETINSNEDIKIKWKWAFNKKENQIHLFENEIDLEKNKDIQQLLEIFNDIFQKEKEKNEINSNIPKIFYFSTNDIYNSLKRKLQREPTITEIEGFKNILILKIISFFNEYPEYTFEFPLYKEFINKNPHLIENNPEYSVESFIMEYLDGIQYVEELNNF